MSLIFRAIFSSIVGATLALSVLGISAVMHPQYASAQSATEESIFPAETSIKNLDQAEVTKKIFYTILGFLGLLSLVTLLLGGVKWMTAGGNDDAYSEAQKLFISGLIGFLLILSTWAIVVYVLKSLSAPNL
ncbi:hypothetical protein COY25_01840 [Candidatus Uhrbacteria bacterium CG_4_10_14_0_2_um_filter_41_7]|uniref:Uncharacterized protein n=1 Tax=Candidatus Uhrbacteria bacterium CG_4_9_14_3_um_filter_41_35 TaxID=1975034 RepID=A0A2M7XED8_9BACT|nr:MAG: hypothetical protein COY25_01840 [Candidatus Uhrbacteria bacterium CG_4_10_14_0_2_um_filter_41_7]PJA46234.1 MAG: hypothetical protein CO173_03375 [Candidatus Uhrbacteria bacterium CG_4_9_14_3_um_filter_41_35]